MRYYSPGDAIYIFGFSRGAYTARFLAEMVQTIGLLSQGNEEMVRFAWNAFSKSKEARGLYPNTEEDKKNIKFMNDFKSTFCREGVFIHFLGLFDCVNSLGQFDTPIWRINYRSIAMPAAKHIRHAVSIHERRLKFKPALFVQDQLQGEPDIKEFWFAGNHGDVGGGWEKPRGQKNQLSDTPLEWMVQELLNLKDTPNKLSFKTTNVRLLETRESDLERSLQRGLTDHEKLTLDMKPHDMLRFGGGAPWYRVMGWWIIGSFPHCMQPVDCSLMSTEFLPFQTRLKLIDGAWIPRHWPPNMGASRDVSLSWELSWVWCWNFRIQIPKDADFHPTFKEMCKAGLMEMPKVGGDIE